MNFYETSIYLFSVSWRCGEKPQGSKETRPYAGEIEKNVTAARKYSRFAVDSGFIPIAPHLLFPQFLNDNDPEQRILGITLGVEQMKVCDEIWIFGGRISNGMAFELEQAKELGIPARLYDDDGNRISPATMMIDDRVSEEYRKAIHGLKFV